MPAPLAATRAVELCRAESIGARTLQRDGTHVYTNRLKEKLQRLHEAVDAGRVENRDEVLEFIAVLEPDAKKQDEYIVNINEVRTEYGTQAAELIKRALTD